MRIAPRRAKAILAVLTLCTAAALATAAPAAPALAAASSSSIANTNGTRAAEAWFNRANGTHGNRAWFDVHDAKCDANSVYVEWDYNNEWWLPNPIAHNDGGCGTTAGVNLRSGAFNIQYRVCVNDGGLSDTCGPWRSDHN